MREFFARIIRSSRYSFPVMAIIIFTMSPVVLNCQSIGHGTLNVVLANRNGCVVATDSRMTFGTGKAQDTAQKLFRVGERTVIAIAGFGSILPPSPLQFEVAALIRSKFDTDSRTGRKPDDSKASTNDRSAEIIGDWLNDSMTTQLTQIANILLAASGRVNTSHLNFLATVVECPIDRPAKISLYDLSASPMAIGKRRFPVFEVNRSETTSVDRFVWRTRAMDTIAKNILMGHHASKSSVLNAYKHKLASGRVDSMSIEEMRKIILAIFQETEKDATLGLGVGGAIQMGTFPRRRKKMALFPQSTKVTWQHQDFPAPARFLMNTAISIGSEINEGIRESGYFQQVWDGGPNGTRISTGPEKGSIAVWTPPKPQTAHIFGVFTRSSIWLDHDIFVGCKFENSILKMISRPKIFTHNTCVNSSLTIANASGQERTVQLDSSCRPIQ